MFDLLLNAELSGFIIIVVLIVAGLSIFFRFIPVGLWITAYFSGVKIGLFTLVGMRLRRVNPNSIIRPLIKATKAGLDIDVNSLEAHHLAGGNINDVVDALIASERANILLTFEQACAIDLAGRNVFEAVQVSVNPKVIETPNISAVSNDGIEIIARAKVTVRANIERLVGGAGEDTIIARVGEGIVTTVGSSKRHTEVLENPDLISQTVLNKGLDSGTAFEILSIDIADVDVGRNIGAKLQTEQSEADKKIAQAKAEERRSMAIAKEQEMIASVQEQRAKVIEAEAQIPLAMAEALRSGNLGVMDYYQLKNVQADTVMREAVSREIKDESSATETDHQ
ncbi:flotillin-like protein FloA [Allofustis seminis]|uniref:flotillin-like protein FloA n=1 Tax=Allofustis seminis TaxID=166939 RepID=UPI00036B8510|nr:flotillin-like protein FloA [Allofustis seminis]